MQIDVLHRLMRMEVRLPSSKAIAVYWRWFLDGLSVFLPAFVTQKGWRADALLIEQQSEPGPRIRTVETSWFGKARLREAVVRQDLPARLALAPDKLFTTKLSLPEEAAQSLAKAARLRLGDLSPIPPEDAAFAIGKPQRGAQGRIVADLMIVRKETIDKARAEGEDRPIEMIGAAPDEQGRLRFVFENGDAAPTSTANIFFDIGVLAAAILFLLFAANVHMERRLQNIAQYEAEALAELKALRPMAALFEGLQTEQLDNVQGVNASDAFALVRRTLAALPEGARVSGFQTDGHTISVNGFVSGTASFEASPEDRWTYAPSPHPGFDRFTLQSERESGA